MIEFMMDNELATGEENELLIEVLNRAGKEVPHLCYHAQLGPLRPAIPACAKSMTGWLEPALRELPRGCAFQKRPRVPLLGKPRHSTAS
jgi:predicted molibdopterin-dependent oxidoreductase YjgC